jgi:hypothetical protein
MSCPPFAPSSLAFGSEVGRCKKQNAVFIAGCTGDKASAINGTYIRLPSDDAEECSKHSLFIKSGNPAVCIGYTRFERWMVHATQEKDSNTGVGFAISNEEGLEHPADSPGWMVGEGTGAWLVQSSLTCVRLSEKEAGAAEMIATKDMSDLRFAKGWVIEGATGPFSTTINGAFKLSDEVVNGKPVFVKIGQNGWCLWYSPHSSWVVSVTKAKERNQPNGIMSSVEYGISSPAEVTGWKVNNATAFQTCCTVSMTPLSDIWRLSKYRTGGFLQFPLSLRPASLIAPWMILWPWNKNALWTVFLICNRLMQTPTFGLSQMPPEMWESILGMIAVKDLGQKLK